MSYFLSFILCRPSLKRLCIGLDSTLLDLKPQLQQSEWNFSSNTSLFRKCQVYKLFLTGAISPLWYVCAWVNCLVFSCCKNRGFQQHQQRAMSKIVDLRKFFFPLWPRRHFVRSHLNKIFFRLLASTRRFLWRFFWVSLVILTRSAPSRGQKNVRSVYFSTIHAWKCWAMRHDPPGKMMTAACSQLHTVRTHRQYSHTNPHCAMKGEIRFQGDKWLPSFISPPS